MAWLLLITHPAALYLFWYAPRFWVTKDVAAFAADGAADSLHGTFHAQRLAWRIALAVLVAALASAPALPSGWCFASSFLALVNIGAAYFFYDFNPRLSRARGLPAYYVSFDPCAARFPDNWLADRAKVAIPWGPQMLGYEQAQALQRRRQDWAAGRLQRLSTQVLEAGAIVYLAFLAATYFLQ
jgi:hypothetical protein